MPPPSTASVIARPVATVRSTIPIRSKSAATANASSSTPNVSRPRKDGTRSRLRALAGFGALPLGGHGVAYW